MKQLNLRDFLFQFQPGMQVKLQNYLAREDLNVFAAFEVSPGKLSVSAFSGFPAEWPNRTVSVYCKQGLRLEPEAPQTPEVEDDMTQSKTMKALALIEKGLTPYAAAQQVGVSRQAVYRAIARREDKDLCPCCGQVVREGFKIDKSIIKKR